MFAECMKTSKTDQWETPQWLFDMYNEDIGFELDVCALSENAKCNAIDTIGEERLKKYYFGVKR